jgi:uncharacterized protein (DUF58 family)
VTLEQVFTRRRLYVLMPAFLLFAAWNRESDLLLFVGVLAAVTAATAWVVPLVQLRGVAVRREQPASAREDEPFPWRLHIENTTRWPRLLLEFADAVPATLEANLAPRLCVGVLAPFGRTTVEGKLRFPRRGLHRMGPLRIETAFPGGILLRARELPESIVDVTVFPSLFPIARLDPPPGGRGPARFGTPVLQPAGDGEFHGVREYRRGDSPRRIHWRASARHGALLVKELERESATRRLVIALDTHHLFQAGSDREAAFEYAVRIAGSLARHCLANGWEVGLACGGRAPAIRPAGGAAHLSPILRALATVECDGTAPYSATLRTAAVLAGPAGTLAVFVQGLTSNAPATDHPRLEFRFDTDSFGRRAPDDHIVPKVRRQASGDVYTVRCGKRWCATDRTCSGPA